MFPSRDSLDNSSSGAIYSSVSGALLNSADTLAECLELFSEYDISRNRVKDRRFSF